MASPEVSMQDVSEVVIVTMPPTEAEDLLSGVEEEEEEEEEEEDDDKVVLATEELTTEQGEEVLTVAAVDSEAEAGGPDSFSPEEAVIVKLTEEVDVEADVFYSVTCGDAKATLVWKKFVCPGINVKCVQFNEQLISPKEFVCLAGKSTLKDWKRAIRLNGTMLRKIMDSGELDFYQHAAVCSNTCRSTKIDLVGTKVSVGGDPAAELLPVASSADMNGAAVSYPDVAEETSEWVTAIGEDSVAFWRTVKEAGLLEEVVEDFQKELQEVLQGLQERVCDPPLQVKDAVLLNNIVQNFGMLDLVKKVLASHKSQMDRYREQYTRSLAALEQQCDEHRKRAKELKSKSQHLNNVLMTLAPAPAPPPPKRPRLTRAVSGPAGAGQVSLPLGQLTGLPLGKLLTVSGGAGGPNLGGYTLLTSSLSELGADGANLTLLTAGQDGGVGGGGFVKVLGPQFQLVTLQAALQSLAAAQHTAGGITLVDAGAAEDEEEEESQEESPADGGGGGEEEESQQEQEDGEQQ